MQAEQIVNQLKAVLPRYTGDFTKNTSITSLTRSASTATATTNVAHQLAVGNKVLINGAKVPVVISSLTRNGDYALAITSTPHPLIRGTKTVEISGANQTDYNGIKTLYTDKNNFLAAPSIEIESIIISGSTATVTTKTPHGYILNANIEVELTGITPEVYNKKTTLVSVPSTTTFTYTVFGTEENGTHAFSKIMKVRQLINSNTFIFEVANSPTTPATGTITQLTSYKAGYNGYKTVVSVPTTTSFTFACDSTLGTPAQGTMTIRTNPTITGSIDYERASQMFQSDSDSGQPTKWISVVVGDEITSKNQNTKTDGTSTYQSGNEIRENSYQNITLYIFIPCGEVNDQLLYALTRDVASSYKPYIFKALLGFQPASNLSQLKYSGLISVSNGMFVFNGSYYVHQYIFQASCWFNQADAIDPDDVFAFREFDLDVLNLDFDESVMEIAGDVDQQN
jgi:hypothetical protein